MDLEQCNDVKNIDVATVALTRVLGNVCRDLKVFHGVPSVSSSNYQAESLKYKLLGGLAVRRACYGVLRFIMESGAKGAEVCMELCTLVPLHC